MFNVDKDSLKTHMERFIQESNNLHISFDEYTSGYDIVDEINTFVKNKMQFVVNELIDKLYTTKEFEKDIGLSDE